MDYVFMVLALVGVSMPIFWMGMMLVNQFSVQWGLLPALGRGRWTWDCGTLSRI